MKITRDTMRADGLTVGQAMDRDAASLRALGFDAKDGAQTRDERMEEFQEKMRKAVLEAMDGVAESLTGNREDGPKGSELGELFPGIDAIADRIFNNGVAS